MSVYCFKMIYSLSFCFRKLVKNIRLALDELLQLLVNHGEHANEEKL